MQNFILYAPLLVKNLVLMTPREGGGGGGLIPVKKRRAAHVKHLSMTPKYGKQKQLCPEIWVLIYLLTNLVQCLR